MLFFSDTIDRMHKGEQATEEYTDDGNDRHVVSFERANLVSSLLPNGNHAPAIDVDVPCSLRETSPGKFHLFIDVECSWKDYIDLLAAMVKCGIVEQGYFAASISRGRTDLRLPHVTKGPSAPALTHFAGVPIGSWLLEEGDVDLSNDNVPF